MPNAHANEQAQQNAERRATTPEVVLVAWLQKCQKADLTDSGDYTNVSAAFGAALAEDSNLKAVARARLEALILVNRVRGGRDHITSQQIKFLNEAGVV